MRARPASRAGRSTGVDRRGQRAGRVAQRAAAARRPVVEREHAASSTARRLDRRARGVERVAELVGIAAAGLGHRVASAASAARDLGRGLDDRAGLDAALDQRRRDAGDEDGRGRRPAAPSTIAASPSLRLDPVEQLEQLLRVGRLDDGGEQPRAVDRRRRRCASASTSSRRGCAPPRLGRPPWPFARAALATASGTCSGRVRSAVGDVAQRARRGARSSATASGPVIASMRRTFAALEVSVEDLEERRSRRSSARACRRTARARTRRRRPRPSARRRRTSRRTAPSRRAPAPRRASS